MEKLSRRKVLVNLAAAGAGAAIAGAAKAQGTEDPNLSAQKERLRNVLDHGRVFPGKESDNCSSPIRTKMVECNKDGHDRQ
jgi:hypothetical protein